MRLDAIARAHCSCCRKILIQDRPERERMELLQMLCQEGIRMVTWWLIARDSILGLRRCGECSPIGYSIDSEPAEPGWSFQEIGGWMFLENLPSLFGKFGFRSD